MPFDGRWSYGDALFIVDPWVWLVLGGVLFLRYSRSKAAFALWAVFWGLGTWLCCSAPFIPAPSRFCGLRASWRCSPARILRPEMLRGPPASERLARVALGCIVAYMAAALVASAVARREVRTTLAALGIEPVTSVMVGPAAANPFAGSVVVETPGQYRVGRVALVRRAAPCGSTRSRSSDTRTIRSSLPPVGHGPRGDYLTWSRYPYFEIESRRRWPCRARARCALSRPEGARGPRRAPRPQPSAATVRQRSTENQGKPVRVSVPRVHSSANRQPIRLA